MKTTDDKLVTEANLSPRRKAALKLFREHGYTAIPKVAKAMKITTNAAYQYRRYLEDAKLISEATYAGGTREPNGGEPGHTNGNGNGSNAAAEIDQIIERAIGVADRRLTVISARRENLAEEIEAVQAEFQGKIADLQKEDAVLADEEKHLAGTHKKLPEILEVNATH